MVRKRKSENKAKIGDLCDPSFVALVKQLGYTIGCDDELPANI